MSGGGGVCPWQRANTYYTGRDQEDMLRRVCPSSPTFMPSQSFFSKGPNENLELFPRLKTPVEVARIGPSILFISHEGVSSVM